MPSTLEWSHESLEHSDFYLLEFYVGIAYGFFVLDYVSLWCYQHKFLETKSAEILSSVFW